MPIPSQHAPVDVDIDADDLDEPKPIRLVSAIEDIAGWIVPRGERVSDLLQRGTPVMILPLDSTSGEWLALETSELLVVVPPPHISRPDRRIQHQRHPVVVRLGPWRVDGTAHLMPGEEYDPYLRSKRQFLPITEAILSCDDGRPSQTHETVIVNLKRLDDFRVL